MRKSYGKSQSSYKTIQPGHQDLKQQNWPVCRIIPESDGQSSTTAQVTETQQQVNNASSQPGKSPVGKMVESTAARLGIGVRRSG